MGTSTRPLDQPVGSWSWPLDQSVVSKASGSIQSAFAPASCFPSNLRRVIFSQIYKLCEKVRLRTGFKEKDAGQSVLDSPSDNAAEWVGEPSHSAARTFR